MQNASALPMCCDMVYYKYVNGKSILYSKRIEKYQPNIKKYTVQLSAPSLSSAQDALRVCCQKKLNVLKMSH